MIKVMKTKMPKCPDCGVRIGEPHLDGCDVAQCSHCGRQAFSCDCDKQANPPLPWAGGWPGEAECREFGWYAKLVLGRGWVRCEAGEEFGHEDIVRLYLDAEWDPATKRFERRALACAA